MPESTTISTARFGLSLLDRLSSVPVEEYATGARKLFKGNGINGAKGDGADTQVGRRDFEQCVRRDLEWLFNTTPSLGPISSEKLKKFPNVASSVVNYGLRAIFGRPVEDLVQIESLIATALAHFEPRLKVDSQRLEVTQEGQIVSIIIEGSLIAKRVSRRLVVRTDLETIYSKLESNG